MTLITLRKRSDFLRLRGGRRCNGLAFLLESKPSPDDAFDTATTPRFGFTITKKLGNAVLRNRIRRRLRHAIDDLAGDVARAGFDYVIVARRAAATQPFDELKKDLERCFQRVHDPEHKNKRRPASNRA